MSLEAAIDDLILTNELQAFCDLQTSIREMDELATAISGDLDQP
jgi:hypothetical protein